MRTSLAEGAHARLVEEVLEGLRGSPKMLPPKLFYDERGAALFEEITTLPEYYPTRTEVSILHANAAAIAAWVGPNARIVEFGSGSGEKTRLLLRHLRMPAEYVPIDIAAPQLSDFAAALRMEFPGLKVRPIVADYTRHVALPQTAPAAGRTVVFFPGSTIGNFEPPEAEAFLDIAARIGGPGAGLLIGVDLEKDVHVIEAAYNDAAGVTAAFNLNILRHVNRLVAGNFDPDRFLHHAQYNAAHSRIEMHLVSTSDHHVTVAPPGGVREHFRFVRGEHLVTEYSHKFTLDGFTSLAAPAGYSLHTAWTDPARWFAVMAFDAVRD